MAEIAMNPGGIGSTRLDVPERAVLVEQMFKL